VFNSEQRWNRFLNDKKYDATDDNRDVIFIKVILRQDNAHSWHKATFDVRSGAYSSNRTNRVAALGGKFGGKFGGKNSLGADLGAENCPVLHVIV